MRDHRVEIAESRVRLLRREIARARAWRKHIWFLLAARAARAGWSRLVGEDAVPLELPDSPGGD